MDHMKLTDELRQHLMESAAWGKSEVAPRLTETKEEETKEVVEEATTEVAETEAKEEETVEEDCEATQAHVCPLCVSQLDEALEEERVLEHLNVVLGLVDRLSQMNEGDEDLDAVIDATVAEILLNRVEEEETE
jgi:hypothetical protein